MIKFKHKFHIDYETRSAVDLKKTGHHIYATSPTTDALCMAYALDEEDIKLWVLGEPMPGVFKDYAEDPEVMFTAHNAAFEFHMWNFVCAKNYGWPQIPMNRFDCTMVRAFAMGLPGALEKAAKAVGMPYEKDMHGYRVMMQLCKPRSGPIDDCGTCRGKGLMNMAGFWETCYCVQWWESRDSTPKVDIRQKYQDLYKYCPQDVVVARELDKRVLPLSPHERKIWLLDQKINFRGVQLDERAALSAIEMVKTEQLKFNGLMKEKTNGFVNTCNSSVKMAVWITDQGVDCASVAKAFVLDMLELDDLPNHVRDVLHLRQEASKSSTAKLKAMITGKSPDGRVRGCFQYNGAASTRRWAGRRIQLQNIKRPDLDQEEIDLIMDNLSQVPPEEAKAYLDIFHGSVISPISDCVRAMLCAAPGKTLYSPDYSAIEGRVLAWLAGQEDKLAIYRSHGKVYEATAAELFGINFDDVTKKQRLIGKVCELALGYQGGLGAFQSMAKIYFIKIPDTQAELHKINWRRANPFIVQYWYDLERAAMAAVAHPGQKFAVGPRGRQVTFLVSGSFLFCKLPSNGVVPYPYPKIKKVMTPWGEEKDAVTYKATVFGKFVTKVAYGGLICNNVTQSTARDLLAQAMLRFDELGHPIVMHTHDEVVIEKENGLLDITEVENIMCELPLWARDLPVTSNAWIGSRYRK